MSLTPSLVASYRCFDGTQNQYTHQSAVLNCEMRFSIYLPPIALSGTPVPVIYWLSGLTCSDENFVQKAGAQRIAAEFGLAIVTPDTSPRGDTVANDEVYDLGQGAGFYLNATQAPWDSHFNMYDYVRNELPTLITTHFPVTGETAISGHSMGGHGALTLAMRNPGQYRSVSAFSPICHPTQCPWGQKAFSHYLGDNRADWEQYDAVLIMRSGGAKLPMLVDQGTADNFLEEQLNTEALIATVQDTAYPAQIRYQPGYDHSYFFIATFIEEHLRFHHQHLTTAQR